MADFSISQLTEQTTVDDEHLVEVTVDAATTPASKKMKRSTLVDGLATEAALTTHTSNTSNPHSVTKAQVGLSNVDNTADTAKPISTATQTALDAKASVTSLNTHIADSGNPHSVTKTQVGLSNVDNTADLAKPISTATQTALDGKASLASIASFETTTQLNTRDTNNRARANHTGAQAISTVTGLQTALDAKANTVDIPATIVESVVAGTNVTVDNTDPANPVISASGGGGGGGAVDSVNGATGVVVLDQDDVLDGTTSKQYSATEKTKLAGIATGATANDTDANLKNRANHTGTQTASTISDFQTAVSANADVTAAATTATWGNIGGDVGSQLDIMTIIENKADAEHNHDLSYISDVTATAAEVNILDGATVSTTELNYVAGVTSTIQTQLDAKAPTASPTFTGTVSGITKSMVGLGNVDNTADTAKPISTATQTALDAKASTTHAHAASDITSGVFNIARLATGTPDGTKFVRDDGTLATPAGGGSSAPRYTRYFPAPADNSLWNEYVASGGTVTYNNGSGGYTRLAAGTTSGGNVEFVPKMNAAHMAKASVMKNPHMTAGIGIAGTAGTGSAWFRFFSSVGSSQTNTAKQIGFKWLKSGGVVTTSATNGDGTTETATALTMDLAATSAQVYTAIMTDSTNIKYYTNGSLKATHTTNLPPRTSTDYVNYVPEMKVQNDSTTDTYVLDYYFMTLSAESY